MKASRWLLFSSFLFLGGCNLSSYPLLDPAGPVGRSELHLIVIAFLLMLIPVVPVIFMTFWFAWRYRASNRSATYKPFWSHSKAIEAIVWGVPILIVTGLSILSWITTHQLDPYRPLATASGTHKPLRVDVVALNWKWLFLYPDQGVATVNQLVVPVDTPIDLRLTADDAPMTAFFIPRLGTQIYAMAGMVTRLHLMATSPGTFFGVNTQISGKGYSKMHFHVIAAPYRSYEAWLAKVRSSPHRLDIVTYRRLERPSLNNPVTYYSTVAPDNLFADIVRKYIGGVMLASDPLHNPATPHFGG